MADISDRNAAVDALVRATINGSEEDIVEALFHLNQSAEPERKTGRWERHYSRPGVFADLFWHCSCCGYKNDEQYANVYHKFCPNCGAEMEGEEDG